MTQNQEIVVIRWPKWMPEFLGHLAKYQGNAAAAVKGVDVSRATIYRTRKKDRYFGSLWDSIVSGTERARE